MKLIKENSSKQRFLEAKEAADIEVKNTGLLEVPEGKKVDELPLSHFEKLVDKKGYDKVIRALNNLQVWNKNDDKSLSAWAKSTMAKLKKKYRKDESYLKEFLNDYEFIVKCNDQPSSRIRVVAENEDKAKKYAKYTYAQEHTTYADDRENKWVIKDSSGKLLKEDTKSFKNDDPQVGDKFESPRGNHIVREVFKSKKEAEATPGYGYWFTTDDDWDIFAFEGNGYKVGISPSFLRIRARGLKEDYLKEDTLRTPRGLIYVYSGTWDEFKEDPEYQGYSLWFDHGVPEDLPYSEVDEWWKIMSKNNRAVAVLYKKDGRLNIRKDLAESRKAKIEENKKDLKEKATIPLARDWDKLFSLLDEMGLVTIKDLKNFHNEYPDMDLVDAIVEHRRKLGKRWKMKKGESLEEDVADPKEIAPTPETPNDNALTLILNKLVISEYDAIDDYNSAIVNAKELGREDLVDILTTIAHDENTHVGNLLVALKLVNPQTQAIDKGEQQAIDTLEGDTVIEEGN